MESIIINSFKGKLSYPSKFNLTFTRTAKGVFQEIDLENKTVISKVACLQDELKYNSISSIEVLSPSVYMFGMKNGKLEIVDTRIQKKVLNMMFSIHKNGISYLQITKGKNTFFTNGRDSRIKFFDIRGLGLNANDGFKKRAIELSHIFEFKDHNSENFNITPCMLENEKYIVTGSLDNLVNFKSSIFFN